MCCLNTVNVPLELAYYVHCTQLFYLPDLNRPFSRTYLPVTFVHMHTKVRYVQSSFIAGESNCSSLCSGYSITYAYKFTHVLTGIDKCFTMSLWPM